MKCPFCLDGVMGEWSREKTIRINDSEVVHVHGYLSNVCASCGGEVVTREQFTSNVELVQTNTKQTNFIV